MPEYSAMSYARSSCEAIKGALERVGLTASAVPIAPYGAALAIERPETPFEPGNGVLIFVSADGSAPSSATMVAGVMHGISADGASLLALCNGLNQWRSYSCVAYPGDAGADVVLKVALPPQIYVDVPQFLKATVFGIAQEVLRARDLISSREFVGVPHTFCDADIRRILEQIHT